MTEIEVKNLIKETVMTTLEEAGLISKYVPRSQVIRMLPARMVQRAIKQCPLRPY